MATPLQRHAGDAVNIIHKAEVPTDNKAYPEIKLVASPAYSKLVAVEFGGQRTLVNARRLVLAVIAVADVGEEIKINFRS